MGTESVKDTLVFKNFGQRLYADLGSGGSVRFRMGDCDVQLTPEEFEKLSLARHKAAGLDQKGRKER